MPGDLLDPEGTEASRRVDRDVEPSGSPVALESLAPADLTAAADSLLGAEPAVYKNPSGFPRVPPISQFDGGPFQGANCTLTSGAMLARLVPADHRASAYGIFDGIFGVAWFLGSAAIGGL